MVDDRLLVGPIPAVKLQAAAAFAQRPERRGGVVVLGPSGPAPTWPRAPPHPAQLPAPPPVAPPDVGFGAAGPGELVFKQVGVV